MYRYQLNKKAEKIIFRGSWNDVASWLAKSSTPCPGGVNALAGLRDYTTARACSPGKRSAAEAVSRAAG
jgi:hypothetical protein